ncbi:unnamed protein product, partial [Allacma fusca]
NMAEMFLDDEAVESDLVTSEDELEEDDCHSTTSEEEVDSGAAVIENVGKGPPPAAAVTQAVAATGTPAADTDDSLNTNVGTPPSIIPPALILEIGETFHRKPTQNESLNDTVLLLA